MSVEISVMKGWCALFDVTANKVEVLTPRTLVIVDGHGVE